MDSDNHSSCFEDRSPERISLWCDDYPNLRVISQTVQIIDVKPQLNKIYPEMPHKTIFYEVESYPTINTAEIYSISQKSLSFK